MEGNNMNAKDIYISMRTGEHICGPLTDETAIEVVSQTPEDAAENCYCLLREKAGYSIEQAVIYVLETACGNPQPNPFKK